MIKIYQVMSNPYGAPNPFVYALMDGINALHNDIKWEWGYEKFWTNQIFDYNIILFHWPDALLLDKIHSFDEFKQKLIAIKSHNIKIVSFVHNIEPHYCIDQARIKCYELVYSSADELLHMGKVSIDIMKAKYPKSKNIYIAPHYTYDQIYKTQYTKKRALAKLGLNPKCKYILAFGAFRDNEERALVFNLAQDLKQLDSNIVILAPSYIDLAPTKIWFSLKKRYLQYQLKHKHHIICNGGSNNTISDAMLPYYYAAADICLIHRKKILNSGNVSMGFFMNKVVAGPNVGNVGEMLKETGNPTFNPQDRKSICNSVLKAFDLATEKKGLQNHDYAMSHFSTEIFCQNLHKEFVHLISETNKDN